jgi:FMN reductase
MQQAPLVVGIGGSTGTVSITNRLLDECLRLAAARGVRTHMVSGESLAELPLYNVTTDGAPYVALPLLEGVRAASAVVIATPGYHGGMSGLVKNALDHLEALRDDPVAPYLDGRAVGVIVSAAGWQACGTALVSVRSAVHALRGWPTPFGVTVNSAEVVEDADGRFTPRIAGALQILATQVTDFIAWRTAGLTATGH